MAADLPLYLLLVILLGIPLILFAASRRPRAGSLRLPPGPWALPVIGHLHHLAAAGALPHRALRDLARRHGPLMSLRLGELSFVVASSPDAAREVLRTQDTAFASRPVSPMLELAYQASKGVVFAPYGEGWRQLRRICALELLSARRVQSFRPVREGEVGRLLLSVAASSSSPVNLSQSIAAYVADATVRAIIGSRFKHRDAYLRMLHEGLKIAPGRTLPDLFPSSRLALLVSRARRRIERHRRGMQQFIDAIIAEHQKRRASAKQEEDDEDLLDVLLRLQEEADPRCPLTTEIIKAVVQELFGAGSETAATTLQWAMAELMRNPRVMRKAQDEVRRALAGHGKVTEKKLPGLRYLPLVIKETLRLHPPAPLLLRRCGRACQVLGFDIPEGTRVLVNGWAMGRDPAHWDAADEFVPERFDDRGDRDYKGTDLEFIPFGAGRRMCPGVAFGLANVELALAALLFHFDWELPAGMAPEDVDMTEAFGSTTGLETDLVLVAVPRVPVSIVE